VLDEMGDTAQAPRFVPGPAVNEKTEGERIEVGQFFGYDADAGVNLFETYLIPYG